MYFKDRTGDTFRWKGENVSTTEVETVIMNQMKLSDVVVYGVPVPGCEGRAGMAAVADLKEQDLTELYTHLEKSLPRFALPIFLRIANDIEKTGTFKLPKVKLQKDGFCPVTVSDPLFFLDLKNGRYSRLDTQRFKDIMDGVIRF